MAELQSGGAEGPRAKMEQICACCELHPQAMAEQHLPYLGRAWQAPASPLQLCPHWQGAGQRHACGCFSGLWTPHSPPPWAGDHLQQPKETRSTCLHGPGSGWGVAGCPSQGTDGLSQPFAGVHWRAHRNTCPRRIWGSRARCSQLWPLGTQESSCPHWPILPSLGAWDQALAGWESSRASCITSRPQLLQGSLAPTYPSDVLRYGECTVKDRRKNAQLLKLCRHKAAQASCCADTAGPHA